MHKWTNEVGKLWLAALGLLLALVWLYATGFNHDLIFDDTSLLGPTPVFYVGFRELAELSFVVIGAWFGEGWYWQRAANAALHLVTSLLLWLFVFRLIRHVDVDQKTASWAALLATAMWAFNPVAVYAVSYLIQRSMLMATFFTLAVMLSFIEVLRSNTTARRFVWGVAIAAYVLALLSKEMAAPVLGVLFLIFVFWRRPNAKRTFLAGGARNCAIGFGVALMAYMERDFGAAPESQMALFVGPLFQKSPSAADNLYALSVVNQLWLYFYYGLLWLLPLPQWLSIDMRTSFPSSVLAFPQVLGVFLWLSMVAGALYALLKGSPKMRLGGLLFCCLPCSTCPSWCLSGCKSLLCCTGATCGPSHCHRCLPWAFRGCGCR